MVSTLTGEDYLLPKREPFKGKVLSTVILFSSWVICRCYSVAREKKQKKKQFFGGWDFYPSTIWCTVL